MNDLMESMLLWLQLLLLQLLAVTADSVLGFVGAGSGDNASGGCCCGPKPLAA
jgi:hypothetical protein